MIEEGIQQDNNEFKNLLSIMSRKEESPLKYTEVRRNAYVWFVARRLGTTLMRFVHIHIVFPSYIGINKFSTSYYIRRLIVVQNGQH